MDGALFYKEYLKDPEAISHPRFKEIYLNELMELLSDEEAYIRIEAIETTTEVLDKLDKSRVESEYLPVVLNTMDIIIEEIEHRLA